MEKSTNLQSLNQNPIIIFLGAMTGYVVLLTLSSLLESMILKGVAYLAAFLIFLLMLVLSVFSPQQKNYFLGFGFALGIYYYGLIGSVAYNIGNIDWPITLKMLMGPMFIIFGMKFEAYANPLRLNFKIVKLFFICLIFLPLLLWIFQLVIGKATFGSTGAVSIFANRNNASLYTVTLLALFNVLFGRPIKSLIIYFIVGLGFGTLGVFFAVLLSLVINIARNSFHIRLGVLAILSLIGVMYFWNPELVIFARFSAVIDSLRFIFDNQIDLANVTYGELVQVLKTNDLSFIFRLKHWLNLFLVFINGSFPDWIFGFGVGSSVQLTEKHLVPHNDYIRYFFECGVFTFIGFVYLIWLVIKTCGRRWETVPLLVVTLYFFSENLIDNYLAMAIFYFCAGALSLRIKREKLLTKEKT